jgi:hypothetical protein
VWQRTPAMQGRRMAAERRQYSDVLLFKKSSLKQLNTLLKTA